MNPSPLDDNLQTQAFRQWTCELAEAVAGVSDDQQQRHMAWRTLARLMAGRNYLKRIFVAYVLQRQLLDSATRMATVSLVIIMQGEFLGDYPNTFRRQLGEAMDRAMARLGQG